MGKDEWLDNLFFRLSKSKFRSRFKLSLKDKNYIKKVGMIKIKSHAEDFIKKNLTCLLIKDGKQTPMHGHPVFVAQHATATCCRGCLAKWHKIEKTHNLTRKEEDYIVQVIMLWITKEMGDKDEK